ncbi:hypothetical protein [Streptomyces sp. NPDC050485]|uniref:hypothetical protein n=1 Tax=Streptomyces sp. NPDC050485 TaxID=3365617 RepID=UPI0037AED04B
MNRRTLTPAAAALAATAALLLTACSSNDAKPKGSGEIAGAEEGGKPSSSASPVTSPDAKRPDITLPNDVKDVFEGWQTGDPTKDAVLADAARAQTATNYAIIKGNPDEPAMSFYRHQDALVSGQVWVKSFVDAGMIYTGTLRYFTPDIKMFDQKSAGLSFCLDSSKAFNKNLKTGKLDTSPATKDSYILYSTRLEKNAQGIWQTTKLQSEMGNKKCTP